MSAIGYTRPWNREHSSTCWVMAGHESCALRAAVSYLSARMAHDQARMGFLRSAINSAPGSDLQVEAVELARTQLTTNHQQDWSEIA